MPVWSAPARSSTRRTSCRPHTDMLEIAPSHPYRAAASSELSCSATTPGPCVPAASALAHAARFRINPSFAARLVEPTSGVPDHTATRPMNAA